MNTSQIVIVPSRAWYGDIDRALTFPAGWDVHICACQDAPALGPAQIAATFENPIGAPRIRDAAKGRASAAIIVDDLGRPTPAAEMLPFVLEELATAGVPKAETAIVVGGGSHRPLTDEEIIKKVGADVATAYATTSHDFMAGDLVGYGNLDDGTPVYINRIVAEAEFKICVGGIYPHGSAGFGGGAKLIVPGVAGFATIFHFHSFSARRGQGNIERRKATRGGSTLTQRGSAEESLGPGDARDHRDVSEDVARRIGLDMVVNCVLTSRRRIAGVFVGDFVTAHRTGAHFAQRIYGTAIPQTLRQEADLLVCNAYPLDADPIQGPKALWARSCFQQNPYTVVLNPASDGIFYHGLHQQLPWPQYLKRRAAADATADPEAVVGNPESLLIVSEHFQAAEFTTRHGDDILFRSWEALIEQLAAKLPADATVAVFPNASLQILARAEPVASGIPSKQAS